MLDNTQSLDIKLKYFTKLQLNYDKIIIIQKNKSKPISIPTPQTQNDQSSNNDSHDKYKKQIIKQFKQFII